MSTANRVRLCLALSVFFFCASGARVAHAQLYRYHDLGTLGGPYARAYGINKYGRIAGSSTLSDNTERAFRTSAYSAINPGTDNLGTFAGLDSYASSINASGLVVGGSRLYGGSREAFLYDTSMHGLGTLGGAESEARHINASGRVVGWANTADGNPRAFLYDRGYLLNLGTLGGAGSDAFSINTAGRIVGSAQDGNGVWKAFLTAPYSGINPSTDNILGVYGASSRATAINDGGVVIGELYSRPDYPDAFRYVNGTISLIGEDAYPQAINSKGQIVGYFHATGVQSGPYAILWVGDEHQYLNDLVQASAPPLAAAWDINDSGVIVGETLENPTRAFMLKPIQPLSVTLTPSKIAGSLTAQCKVTLNEPAPQDLTVQIACHNPAATTLTSANIAAGNIAVVFNVKTTAVSSNTTGTITATYGGVTKSTNLTVMPISVKSLAFSPSSVIGSNATTGTITLEAPAEPGSVTVNLAASDPSLVTVPSSVVIAQGAQTASFTAGTHYVSLKTVVDVKATANGRSVTTTLTLKPVPPKSITLSPTSVRGGSNSTGTVTLAVPAGPGDLKVTLSSSSAKAQVPGSVTVPAGATQARFTVTTSSVAANTTATISATAGGVTKSAALTVSP